jgi:excisionase family DNA binding protein
LIIITFIKTKLIISETRDNMAKPETEWVSLRRAAEILGVHPATVRNWADEGKIASRRTAGQHRRFSRQDLERHAQVAHDVQPLEVQLILQNALGSTRMQIGENPDLSQIEWYSVMSQSTRETMRHQGRAVLEGLRDYLAKGAPDSLLATAINLGKGYAEALTADELTLPQATRGFFYFSDFVVNAILNWSELTQPRNSSEWANLLRQVNTFINAMLLSIIEYYEEE